jgi:hypothetical protein
MKVQESNREIQHLELMATVKASLLPPTNPGDVEAPAKTLAHFEAHVNDVLHKMHNNQESTHPQNALALKQMEVIARLNQEKEDVAMHKKLKKKAEKKAKKHAERKLSETSQLKAVWKAKQMKKQEEKQLNESAQKPLHDPSR